MWKSIVGAPVLIPLFYEDPLPYIANPLPPPPLFSNFVQLSYPFPIASNHHLHLYFCCLVSLAEWVILDIMDLHMSNLGILVPEGPS